MSDSPKFPEAHYSSLPLCLRHSGPEEALDDARRLVDFLVTFSAYASISCDSVDMPSSAHLGAEQVFALLKDKLDIAAGDYRFPTLSWREDAPVLAERKEEGAL